MRRRKRHTVTRKRERRLHETSPGESPVLPTEGNEARRQSRNRARRGPDRVMHELRPEGNLEVDQLGGARACADSGDPDEAIQVAHASRTGIELDRVPTSEQPGHHRLGDARCER